MSKELPEPKSAMGRLLRVLNASQREEFAQRAGTTEGYLYQLAGLHSRNPKLKLSLGLVRASEEMVAIYGEPIFALTLDDLLSAAEGDED